MKLFLSSKNLILCWFMYVQTWAAYLGNTKYEYFKIFLPLRFYVELILVILKPKKRYFDHLSCSEFWIVGQILTFLQNQNSKPPKWLLGFYADHRGPRTYADLELLFFFFHFLIKSKIRILRRPIERARSRPNTQSRSLVIREI